MSKNTGGPAYPVSRVGVYDYDKGLTIRDHFAGLAMQGFISSGAFTTATSSWVSELAYCYADAMLAEREKEQ